MEGWIKLHRKMLDNPVVFKDSDYLAVWIYLLLNATHKEHLIMFKGKKKILEPGQLITGRKAISERLSINESKIQRILKQLEIEQQIEQQTTNQNRLITIVNWGKYQVDEQQDEQLVNIKRTTDEQPVNTNKNDKNIKNERNNIYSSNFESLWSVYPRKIGKAAAFKNYNARINGGYSEEELMVAVKNYDAECKAENREEKYIKHCATFLGPNTPFTDYLKKEEINAENTSGRAASDYYKQFMQ